MEPKSRNQQYHSNGTTLKTDDINRAKLHTDGGTSVCSYLTLPVTLRKPTALGVDSFSFCKFIMKKIFKMNMDNEKKLKFAFSF